MLIAADTTRVRAWGARSANSPTALRTSTAASIGNDPWVLTHKTASSAVLTVNVAVWTLPRRHRSTMKSTVARYTSSSTCGLTPTDIIVQRNARATVSTTGAAENPRARRRTATIRKAVIHNVAARMLFPVAPKLVSTRLITASKSHWCTTHIPDAVHEYRSLPEKAVPSRTCRPFAMCQP